MVNYVAGYLRESQSPPSLFHLTDTMNFIISHGPDEEWFPSEEEAVDAAFNWSVDLGGETITVSRVHHGQLFPYLEVFT